MSALHVMPLGPTLRGAEEEATRRVKDKSYRRSPLGQEVGRYLRALRWSGYPDTTLDSYEGTLARLSLEHDDFEGVGGFCTPVGPQYLRDFLERHWGEAAARGTDVHSVAEQLHLGNVVEYEPAIEPYVAQYRRFLEDFQPQFLMAEAPVYNLTMRYAGTLDGVAVMDGKTVVVDIKTTAHGPNATNASGRPKARPPFPEVALQLTLYRRAELVGLLADRKEIQYRRYYVFDPEAHTEPMPEVEGGVCVVISPEDYLVVPVDTSERIWKVCRHVIQVAKYQTETSKAVFGPPISPKQEVAA